MENNPIQTAWAARTLPDRSVKDYIDTIDLGKLRSYRRKRTQDQLIAHGYDACVLFDPVNIRYASGSRNMQVFTQHAPARYLFIAAEGPVVLFDSYAIKNRCYPTDTVDELRPAIEWYHELCGPNVAHAARMWADEINDLMKTHCSNGQRIAVDRLHIAGFEEMKRHGLQLFDANRPLELARAIKSEEEISCMALSVAACEIGISRMRAALRPGVTERELWAILVHAVMELGGESMETRLLSSGGRTNPWYRECCEKLIRPGDLVAFDTDAIGPFGYCADISRTFHCGPGKTTAEQKRLYSYAYEQLQYNIQLLQPGRALSDVSRMAWTVPEEFLANRYACLAHGVGLADEYPDIMHPLDWSETTYDGTLEENMTMCVESYIGAEAGCEGVKLEEQVVITGSGPELLSTFPFEDNLLGL